MMVGQADQHKQERAVVSRVAKKKLADSVLDEIKGMIQRGELKEGDKLPNQNDFAAQLGVSRASLREALNTLALIGAIEQRPGLGTVFRGRVPALYTDHLTPPLMSDEASTHELTQARLYLEVDVVELAVVNATTEEVDRLGAIAAEMAAAAKAGEREEYVRRDVAFHCLLAEATHNRFIVHLFVTLRRIMEQFLEEGFSVLPGMMERSLKLHQEIFAAVRSRDRRRAVAKMTRHLLDVEKGLAQYYKVRFQPAEKSRRGA